MTLLKVRLKESDVDKIRRISELLIEHRNEKSKVSRLINRKIALTGGVDSFLCDTDFWDEVSALGVCSAYRAKYDRQIRLLSSILKWPGVYSEHLLVCEEDSWLFDLDALEKRVTDDLVTLVEAAATLEVEVNRIEKEIEEKKKNRNGILAKIAEFFYRKSNDK